jgi:hypothetical protein
LVLEIRVALEALRPHVVEHEEVVPDHHVQLA